MLIGYARVSTQAQEPALQLDALNAAGCEKIFTEKASSAQRSRSELGAALEYMRPGDTLVVWKLDRLARSLRQLIDTVELLQARKMGLRSLTELMDTTTSGGKLIFHIFGALAEFERSVIRERTQAGLASARARGKLGGRPKAWSEQDITAAKALLRDPDISVEDAARRMGVAPSTLYRYIPGGRSAVMEAQEDNPQESNQKTLKVKLYLRIENNNKFVRGKKRSREWIEDFVLSAYDMEKPYKDSGEYILTIPYATDSELDDTIHEILREAASTADSRNCFIEAEVIAMDDSDRYW